MGRSPTIAVPTSTMRYHRAPTRHAKSRPSSLLSPDPPSCKAVSRTAARVGAKDPTSTRTSANGEGSDPPRDVAGIHKTHEMPKASTKNATVWVLLEASNEYPLPVYRRQCSRSVAGCWYNARLEEA